MRRSSIRIVLLSVVLAIGPALIASGADKPVTLDTDPNLVGWWKLDETAGNVAADSSRHQRNGTLQGDLSFDKSSAPGKIDKAVQFGGKNAWIEIKEYKGVTGTRPRSVAAWMKTTAPQGEIVSWGTEDFGQMFVFGFIRGRIGITPHGGYLYMNPETHNGEWRHVAAVVQRAELPNLHDDVKLYLDGAPAEIHDIGLLDLWPLQTGNTLNVRVGRGFKGIVDDLRIYDRPLTDEEINTLFKLESNRPLTPAPAQRK